MSAPSDSRHGQAGDRRAEVERLIKVLEDSPDGADRQLNTLGMLITDASLDADEIALAEAHDGLQWLYRNHEQQAPEFRGRLQGLLDVTQWALRRLPSRLQLALVPSGHAARFLVAVIQRPGLSNQEIAARIEADETEVSRVGRRLLAAGVVMRRKEWRHNIWDATPRGRQYAESSGLLTKAAPAPPTTAALGVGVVVLPHRLVGVVTDRRARVMTCLEQELPPLLDSMTTATEVADFVNHLLKGVPDADAEASVIGVQVGGHVIPESGRVVFAPNHEPEVPLTGASLAGMIEDATDLPTVIENDANALAQYERSFGDGRDTECFATVILGEGIGSGLIAHGRISHGARSAAGEIGHVVVEQPGRACQCGNKGCLETVASAPAIIGIAQESGLSVSDLDAVLTLANEKDGAATAAVERAGRALGRALSMLLNLTNPEKVILYGPQGLVGSPGTHASDLFLDSVRDARDQYTFPTTGTDCELIAKPLSGEVEARAAAAVALARHQ
ncbi:ROK family transcriptional regulator [Actinomadura sp. DC4]|uniref:ROK family transcriptional regulator n=1 Tax=Actinomadura sp. DC4 TaxID=3055069 RepID=UPI0025AEEBDA|nr:ROK family transcriptional regulator [Actinomadura sp. DC4]MDN3353040.1 ROK family transcriptional regulator [Actinomadura sp. DC4]